MIGNITVLIGGVDTLLDEMVRLAREGVKSQYVRRLGEMALEKGTGEDQIVDVSNFLRDTFKYQPDPFGKEMVISPNRFAEDYLSRGIAHRGDCDDLATLSSSVLGSLGYRTRILVVAYDSNDWEHAYSEVLVPDIGWLPFDLASQKPLGFIIPYEKVLYGNITD